MVSKQELCIRTVYAKVMVLHNIIITWERPITEHVLNNYDQLFFHDSSQTPNYLSG